MEYLPTDHPAWGELSFDGSEDMRAGRGRGGRRGSRGSRRGSRGMRRGSRGARRGRGRRVRPRRRHRHHHHWHGDDDRCWGGSCGGYGYWGGGWPYSYGYGWPYYYDWGWGYPYSWDYDVPVVQIQAQPTVVTSPQGAVQPGGLLGDGMTCAQPLSMALNNVCHGPAQDKTCQPINTWQANPANPSILACLPPPSST